MAGAVAGAFSAVLWQPVDALLRKVREASALSGVHEERCACAKTAT